MAEVFRARVHGPFGFQRPIVVKRLWSHLTKEAKIVALFIDEARLASRINHPNIVQVLDLGTDDSGDPYLVMELIDGSDLRRLLEAASARKVRFPTWLSVYLLSEILKGLAHVHQLTGEDGRSLQVIHRDVSPSNIFISMNGEVKLGDFGIARSTMRTIKTDSGAVRGNVPFMAPEALLGHPIDARADIFSVGVVLWACCCGRLPFEGATSIDTSRLICDARRVPPSRINRTVSQDLDRLVLSALAVRVEERPRTSAVFHTQLEAILRRLKPDAGPQAVARAVSVLLGSGPISPDDPDFGVQLQPSTDLPERTIELDADLLAEVMVSVRATTHATGHGPTPVKVTHGVPFDQVWETLTEEQAPAPAPAPDPARLERLLKLIGIHAAAAGNHLTSPPQIALRIADEVHQAKADLQKVVGLVSQDPAVSAGVVKAANSSLFQRGRPVEDLRSAVLRIGLPAVGEITAAVAARSLFEPASHAGQTLFGGELNDLFCEAMTSAFAAAAASMELGIGRSDRALLAGMFHDAGKAVAYRAMGLALAKKPEPAPAAVLAAAIEQAHVELGARIHQTWSMPPYLARIASEHHGVALELDSDVPELAIIQLIDGIQSLRKGQAARVLETRAALQVLGLSRQQVRAVHASIEQQAARVSSLLFRR